MSDPMQSAAALRVIVFGFAWNGGSPAVLRKGVVDMARETREGARTLFAAHPTPLLGRLNGLLAMVVLPFLLLLLAMTMAAVIWLAGSIVGPWE